MKAQASNPRHVSKNKQSHPEPFSFWCSGKFTKAVCFLKSTLSNQNTLSWAQVHKKMDPPTACRRYLKNNRNYNISLKVASPSCTPGHHGKILSKTQPKKAFVFCQGGFKVFLLKLQASLDPSRSQEQILEDETLAQAFIGCLFTEEPNGFLYLKMRPKAGSICS